MVRSRRESRTWESGEVTDESGFWKVGRALGLGRKGKARMGCVVGSVRPSVRPSSVREAEAAVLASAPLEREKHRVF